MKFIMCVQMAYTLQGDRTNTQTHIRTSWILDWKGLSRGLGTDSVKGRENNCITLFIVVVEILRIQMRVQQIRIQINLNLNKNILNSNHLFEEKKLLNVYSSLRIFLSDGFHRSVGPGFRHYLPEVWFKTFAPLRTATIHHNTGWVYNVIG